MTSPVGSSSTGDAAQALLDAVEGASTSSESGKDDASIAGHHEDGEVESAEESESENSEDSEYQAEGESDGEEEEMDAGARSGLAPAVAPTTEEEGEEGGNGEDEGQEGNGSTASAGPAFTAPAGSAAGPGAAPIAAVPFPAVPLAAVAAPAQTLGGPLLVSDAPWQFGRPMQQPLTYHVPRDQHGGTVLMTIPRVINFNNRQELDYANKLRNQNISRRRLTPLKRPSTRNRQYTDANVQWAIAEYHHWASIVGGSRMPMPNFHVAYNNRFPGENRTVASLAAWINRTPAVLAVRNSYPV